jgi:hypothetical protein
MPKTAGLSFRATLEEHFGDAFSYDYADYPLAHQPLERHRKVLQAGLEVLGRDFEGVECIHGHFLPLKYLLLADVRDCRYVTWMREPLARLVSHYHYWQRSYDPESDLTSPLHRRVVEEAWSLERFCLSPELRDVYTQYLWGFPLQRFDFIGITEHYEDDLRYFSTRYLGKNAEPRKVNQRLDAPEGGGEQELPPGLREKVARFHAADLALYRQALELRQGRVEAQPGLVGAAKPLQRRGLGV